MVIHASPYCIVSAYSIGRGPTDRNMNDLWMIKRVRIRQTIASVVSEACPLLSICGYAASDILVGGDTDR